MKENRNLAILLIFFISTPLLSADDDLMIESKYVFIKGEHIGCRLRFTKIPDFNFESLFGEISFARDPKDNFISGIFRIDGRIHRKGVEKKPYF